MSFCQGWRQIQMSLSPYITDNFLIPFLSDSLHIPVSLFLIKRVIDGLQIVREFLPVFVSHVFQRVSHHMYNDRWYSVIGKAAAIASIDLFDYPTSAYQIDDVSRQFD